MPHRIGQADEWLVLPTDAPELISRIDPASGQRTDHTVPAHAKDDPHGPEPADDDSFHDWMDELEDGVVAPKGPSTPSDVAAVTRMKAVDGEMPIEIEAQSLPQVDEALAAGARLGVEARGAQRSDLVEVLAERLAFWSALAEDQARPWKVV